MSKPEDIISDYVLALEQLGNTCVTAWERLQIKSRTYVHEREPFEDTLIVLQHSQDFCQESLS